jgi:hypothetical protein
MQNSLWDKVGESPSRLRRVSDLVSEGTHFYAIPCVTGPHYPQPVGRSGYPETHNSEQFDDTSSPPCVPRLVLGRIAAFSNGHTRPVAAPILPSVSPELVAPDGLFLTWERDPTTTMTIHRLEGDRRSHVALTVSGRVADTCGSTGAPRSAGLNRLTSCAFGRPRACRPR